MPCASLAETFLQPRFGQRSNSDSCRPRLPLSSLRRTYRNKSAPQAGCEARCRTWCAAACARQSIAARGRSPRRLQARGAVPAPLYSSRFCACALRFCRLQATFPACGTASVFCRSTRGFAVCPAPKRRSTRRLCAAAMRPRIILREIALYSRRAIKSSKSTYSSSLSRVWSHTLAGVIIGVCEMRNVFDTCAWSALSLLARRSMSMQSTPAQRRGATSCKSSFIFGRASMLSPETISSYTAPISSSCLRAYSGSAARRGKCKYRSHKITPLNYGNL